MSNYVQLLSLQFDPFDSLSGAPVFFAGAGRQELLDELIQLSNYSQDIAVVTGPLGIGKSSVADSFVRNLEPNFKVIHIQATLFMNRSQLLDALFAGCEIPEPPAEDAVQRLKDRVTQLATAGVSLQLVIDDAHELGEEALELLLTLWRDPALRPAVHLLFLGEQQLLPMLEKLLPFHSEIVPFSSFELLPLGSKDTLAYVQCKLEAAGFYGELPVDTAMLGNIHNSAGGNPGTINALVRDQLQLIKLTPVPARLQIPSVYYATAAVLFAVLLLALFYPQDEQSALADEGGTTVQIQIPLEPPEPSPGVPEESPPAALVVTDVAVTEVPVAAPRSAGLAEVVAPAPAAPAAPVASNTVNAVAARPAPATKPAPAGTPAFTTSEQQLLNRSPQSYTLQLLGSHSENKAREFIAAQSNPAAFRYFESRFQERPWYVVIYGDFADRAAAVTALNALPVGLKTLEPWARGLAGIQADIRKYKQ